MEGRLVAEVAELYSTDEDRIRIINHVGDSAFVPGGRWLIIPIVQPRAMSHEPGAMSRERIAQSAEPTARSP